MMSLFKHDCKTDGHRFEERYDLIDGRGKNEFTAEGIKGYQAREMMEALKDKYYIHDVCVRCGDLIERNGSYTKRRE